jgi:CheY-like chemotaxis protein
MADAISGIVAQKLLKTLCPDCRDVGPPTEEELAMLSGFTDDLPDTVARPVGCPSCRETGYRGREVVAEILPFDRDIARMVREGASIADIRLFCAERGDPLIGSHAIEKIRTLKFPVRAVYEQVLVEEWAFGSTATDDEQDAKKPDTETGPKQQAHQEKRAELDKRKEAAAEAGSDLPAGLRAPSGHPLILVVDDDPDVRALLDLHLSNAGYAVVTAADGVEALIEIGRRDLDAVLSDIRMPNLDGEKLMEMMGQKAVDVPALFLTGVEDEELEGRLLAFGALDYIRKPVRKEVLLMRLRNAVLKGQKDAEADE